MTLPLGFHPRLAKAEREADALKFQSQRAESKAAVQWFANIQRSPAGSTFLFDMSRPDRIPWWHWDFTKPKTKKRLKQWATWRAHRESTWLQRYGDLNFRTRPSTRVWEKGKKYPTLPGEKECSKIFYSVIATMPADAVSWAFYHGHEKLAEAREAGEKWQLSGVYDMYCIQILSHYKRAEYWKARLDPAELWEPPARRYLPSRIAN